MLRSITDEVLIALRGIIRAIDLHSRFLAQHYGLTVPQLVILQELARVGEASGSELAKAVSLSQATVTGILSRLESRGLVTRRRSKSDKRRLPVRLTPDGEQLLEKAPPLLQESFSEEFNRLRNWEQTQILALLQRLVAMMEARTADASPILITGAIESQAPASEAPALAGSAAEAVSVPEKKPDPEDRAESPRRGPKTPPGSRRKGSADSR